MASSVPLNAGHAKQRAGLLRGSPFIVEVFDGADDVLAALEVIERDLVFTAFQSLDWLTVLYEELATGSGPIPCLVVVTDRGSGKVVIALPLAIGREGLLRVASFPDFGVSDYGAPLLGFMPSASPSMIRRAWRAIRNALREVDLIRLKRMPEKIGDRDNPLIAFFGCTPAQEAGHQLVVDQGFDRYLDSIGKKYRKDYERCHRLWKSGGRARLHRATTADEIARVFSIMEEQEAHWRSAHEGKYQNAVPGISPFYERIAIDGSDAGIAALFALEANGETIATILGLVHAETFTMLRISTAGERWGNLSPGRLIVLETVRSLSGEGIRRFDMGCRSNPLPHGFGSTPVPLYDLVIAQDVAALPAAVLHQFGRRVTNSRLKSALPRLRAMLPPRF